MYVYRRLAVALHTGATRRTDEGMVASLIVGLRGPTCQQRLVQLLLWFSTLPETLSIDYTE